VNILDVEVPQAELIDIDVLQLDGENPNKMKIKQLQALRKAIKRWGFIVPIVTNRDLLVADGEQRITVAKELQGEVDTLRNEVEYIRDIAMQMVNKYRALKDIAPARAEVKALGVGTGAPEPKPAEERL
jgi:hypothetical protein